MKITASFFIALGAGLAIAGMPGAVDDIEKLSTSKPPVVAVGHDLSVAVIFPSENTAQLVVFRHNKEEARSSPFELVSSANYGAAWVEQVELKSASSFSVYMRTRQTCGPGIYDYSFAHRNGSWVVSGLERSESECSGEGVAPAWRKSYNYLTGRVETVQFRNERQRTTGKPKGNFLPHSLAEFEALSTRYEQ